MEQDNIFLDGRGVAWEYFRQKDGGFIGRVVIREKGDDSNVFKFKTSGSADKFIQLLKISE